MDVTVTHLNNRLALQIPAELPLGLVFVVGRVSEVNGGGNGRSASSTQFTLIEQDHRVRCVLSARAAAEATLQEGDTIRAGGHLAFDPRRADYYLRVRDVEIVAAPLDAPPLSAVAEREALAAALAEVKKRAEVSTLPQSDLPPWVRRLAPPEVRAQMAQGEGEEETAVVPPIPPAAEESPALNDTLISRLSAAMDSDEEVELTPSLLADLAPALVRKPALTARTEALQQELAAERPAIGYEDPDAYLPRTQRDDNLVTIMIIGFIILAILLVVAIALML